jgi:two-component system, sensor histidine kinase and response regulator
LIESKRIPNSEPPAVASDPVVWVVDDSPLQGEACRQALQGPYEVRVFEGGAAMLEALSLSPQPQLLVLDWHMPDLSGSDVCRFVRQSWDPAQLPILILTASETNESLLEALSSGANDFVRKPFLAPELNARVDVLLRSAALHAKLANAERQLRIEVDFRERFMGLLAHDLRQPLNAVLMANTLLSQTHGDGPLKKTFAIQLRAANRMQRMIAELLDFTRVRPETGMPIHPESTDMAETARSILEELRSAHPERSFNLEVNGPCDGFWDPDRLTQVCTNLIGNAIEHGDPTTPVTVRVDCRDAEHVDLAVSNVGKVISPDALSQLFLPFRRGRARSPGVGLGLYIVQQIVSAHGGTVSAESADGLTRFVVRLPRQPSPTPQVAAHGTLGGIV